jgi:transcriptional regulator with XRE-family HTH domain
MEELGKILRRERDRRRWSQDRLAKTCGISRQQLSRYEAGAATPSWSVFNRVLAAYGMQPRVELEPLDADVVAAINRQRRQPRERWLVDVGPAAHMLHRLLEGLEWRASGMLAARLLGTPAPLHQLEADVVLSTDADWERLMRNAQAGWLEVWDPDECFSSVPMTVATLRRVYEADDRMLRWRTGTDVFLTVRIVPELHGPPVVTEVGDRTWEVVGVDQLAFDDPWMERVLTHLRRERKPG